MQLQSAQKSAEVDLLKDRLSEHAKAHEAKVKDLNAEKEKELAEERRLADIMGKSMAREAAISARQDLLSQQSAAKAHEESTLQVRARESAMKLVAAKTLALAREWVESMAGATPEMWQAMFR